MEDATSSLEYASRLLDTGQIKDAYTAYLTTAQEALSSLGGIKFVHCSIVSKPAQCAALLLNLRTCVTHIESILVKHAPCVAASSPSVIAAPPPLPPKPPRIQKPVLPRKPSHVSLKENQAISSTKHVVSVAQTRDCIKNGKSSSRSATDGNINPTKLVPVQTDTNDNVELKIPQAPLLTQHRHLQTKLDEIESVLANYRTRRRRLLYVDDSPGADERMSEQELNEAIQRYAPCVADTQRAINRVRALYMNASTITSILHFQPALVAHQLALIESSLFREISPDALLTHQAKHRHPRIVASIDFFNYLTRTIEHSILQPSESSARAQHINHWIKVGVKCHELNNYQTLKAVACALATPPIQRLRRTWAYVPKKSMTRLESLNELMSETDNYGRYREHLEQILGSQKPKPTVPFLGMFIHDITYLLAASKDPHNDRRIRVILDRIQAFRDGPEYPTTYQQRKRQPFGPVISGALQRSQSLGNSVTGGSANSAARRAAEDGEERQQLATQYLLSQPWVNEATVDQLSAMREPPPQKRPSRTSTTSGQYVSSTNSLPRFSTGSGSLPDSIEDYLGDDLSDGFWSLRGSIDSYIKSMYKDTPTQDSWAVEGEHSMLT